MFRVEEEIRDFLEAGMTDADALLNNQVILAAGQTVSSFDAQPPVASRIVVQPVANTGDVKAGSVIISGTDGDGNSITESLIFVDNDTRALMTNKLFKPVTSIVWPAQDGSTGEWDVGFAKIKKYYIGEVKPERIPASDLPALMVWGTDEDLVSDQLSTGRDKYVFTINIRVVINVYSKVDASEGVEDDQVMDAQKAVKQLMSERDSDMKPIASSVLGLLRSNVKGVDYLFGNDISISHASENLDGSQAFFSTLTMSNVTRLNTR